MTRDAVAAAKRLIRELQRAPRALHAVTSMLLGLVWRVHAAALQELISPMANLVNLDVSSSGFDDNCASVLASWDGCKRLQCLKLRCSDGVSDVAISGVVAACPNLTQFDASHCRHLSSRAAEAVAATLLCARELRLDECAALGSAALRWVLHSLAGHLGVVSCVGLPFDAATMRVDIGGGGVHGIPYGVRNMVLAEVDVSGCTDVDNEAVSNIAAGCRGLRLLRMARCPRITAGAVFAVGELCEDVATLDFTACAGVQHPFVASIRVCVARRSGHSDEGGGFRIHQHFRALTSVAAGGGVLLCDAEVQWLGVSDVMASVDVGAALGLSDDALAGAVLSPNLTRLSVHGLVALTDATLSAIARQCRRLQYLDAGACPRMSMAGFVRVASACVDLRALDCSVLEAERAADADRPTGVQFGQADDRENRPSLLHVLSATCPLLRTLDASGRDLLEPATYPKLGGRLQLCELMQPLLLLRVSTLSIRGCNLDASVVSAWVLSCPSLTALDLCFTEFDASRTTAASAKFRDLLVRHPLQMLQHVSLDYAVMRPLRGACCVADAMRMQRRMELEHSSAASIQTRYRSYVLKRGGLLWLMRLRKQLLRKLLRRATAGAIGRSWRKSVARQARNVGSRQFGLAWRRHRTRMRVAARVAAAVAAKVVRAAYVADARVRACRSMIRLDSRGCTRWTFTHWLDISDTIGRMRHRVGGRNAGIADLEKRVRKNREYREPSDVRYIDPRGSYARYTQRAAFRNAPPLLAAAMANAQPSVLILRASLGPAVVVTKAMLLLKAEISARLGARAAAAHAAVVKHAAPASLRQLAAVATLVRLFRAWGARSVAARWRRAEIHGRLSYAVDARVRALQEQWIRTRATLCMRRMTQRD